MTATDVRRMFAAIDEAETARKWRERGINSGQADETAAAADLDHYYANPGGDLAGEVEFDNKEGAYYQDGAPLSPALSIFVIPLAGVAWEHPYFVVCAASMADARSAAFGYLWRHADGKDATDIHREFDALATLPDSKIAAIPLAGGAFTLNYLR